MKAIEIGPGNHPVDKNWIIMDVVSRPHVDIVHDVRKLPLPLPDHTYDLVYMSHILEHIPWFKTVDCLKETHRILKTGGSIEIWVPDFAKIIEAYIIKKPGDLWRKYNPTGDFMTWINGRIFTYGPGEENWHRAVFDESSLTQQMEAAGYKHIHKLSKPRGYDHGPINLGLAGVK